MKPQSLYSREDKEGRQWPKAFFLVKFYLFIRKGKDTVSHLISFARTDGPLTARERKILNILAL